MFSQTKRARPLAERVLTRIQKFVNAHEEGKGKQMNNVQISKIITNMGKDYFGFLILCKNTYN